MIVKYRNATADDFLREMVHLNRELSALGNNNNQAVRKLHVLEKIPEFRGWILTNYGLHQKFEAKVTDIHQKGPNCMNNGCKNNIPKKRYIFEM